MTTWGRPSKGWAFLNAVCQSNTASIIMGDAVMQKDLVLSLCTKFKSHAADDMGPVKKHFDKHLEKPLWARRGCWTEYHCIIQELFCSLQVHKSLAHLLNWFWPHICPVNIQKCVQGFLNVTFFPSIWGNLQFGTLTKWEQLSGQP